MTFQKLSIRDFQRDTSLMKLSATTKNYQLVLH